MIKTAIQKTGVCLFLSVVALTGLQGCATSVEPPLPKALAFDHMGPFSVDVASVEVENRYNRAADQEDASSAMPVSLDAALDRYARTRLQPAGQNGALRFVVENASIHHRVVEPSDNKFVDWTGVARKDFYEVEIRVGIDISSPDGWKGKSQSSVNLRRNISIPQSYAVAQKDKEKYDFLEGVMKDLDVAVVGALKDQAVPAGR